MISSYMRGTLLCGAALTAAAFSGCSGAPAPPPTEVNRATADPFVGAADAAFKGDLAYVKACVESDSLYISSFDALGKTLLHHAAEGGQKEVVAYLLENGASPVAVDEEGYSPLDAAARSNVSEDVTQLLIQAENGTQ
jgi:ankyrin repeat protein